MTRIFVISDYNMDIDDISVLEMLSKASELAAACNGVTVLTCVKNENPFKSFGNMLDTASQYGANEIYAAVSASPVTSGAYKSFVAELIKKHMPECVMFTNSEPGKELSSRLSAALNCGLTADCLDISIHGDNDIIFERTALNDSVIAGIKGEKLAVKMTTVKKGSFILRKNCLNPKAKVYSVDCSVYVDEDKRKIPGFIELMGEMIKEPVTEQVDIAQSKILLCAGRGAQNPDTLDLLFKISEKTGAEVACTRCLVDDGFLPRERQVGQSGKSVSPALYITFGVSGASQHIIGMKNSGYVVAVNTDREAPIFSVANYSIVADANEVIREMYDIIVKHDSNILISAD